MAKYEKYRDEEAEDKKETPVIEEPKKEEPKPAEKPAKKAVKSTGTAKVW